MERREMFKKFKLCAIRKFGGCLNSFGYRYRSSKCNTSINGAEFVDLVFDNEIVSRKISINFWIFGSWGNFDKSVSVSISNRDSTLTIWEILEYDKIPYDSTKFSLLSYGGDFDGQVEELCDFIIDFFEVFLS